MVCPKCSKETPATAQFCVYCHTPVRYTCPSCKNQQDHGGQCDKCGTDFAKYAAMLVVQAQSQAELQRDRTNSRQSLLKQLLLLPITGGFSLLKQLRRQARGD